MCVRVRSEVLFYCSYMLTSEKMICVKYLETHPGDTDTSLETLNGHVSIMCCDWMKRKHPDLIRV